MFILFISETELSRVQGLSAAGANVEVLPYTAPADADMLFYDRPKVVDAVPLDPFGHPTPAIVTRAAVIEGGFPVKAVRVGTSVAPAVPCTMISENVGRDPRKSPSVADWEDIAKISEELARELSKSTNKFVIAESIPGGTTTALMLLRALGYEGSVSSAGPVNPLSMKDEIWKEVAARLGIKQGGLKGQGLKAAAEVGDPMQVAVASFVAALPKDASVTLAGGTQMAAVAALIRDMGDMRPIVVATTKYVCDDKVGTFIQYVNQIGVYWYAAPLDFSKSKYEGLADYERGFVKEGVGMGGAVRYAIENGASIEAIIARTEKLYEDMVN